MNWGSFIVFILLVEAVAVCVLLARRPGRDRQ